MARPKQETDAAVLEDDELPKWLREQYANRSAGNATHVENPDKRSSGEVVSADPITELERRLRALKDEPDQNAVRAADNNTKFLPSKLRTQTEQADELIGELTQRVRLDKTYDPVAEIEKRLERLRGHTNKTRFDVIVDRADSTGAGNDAVQVDSDEEAEQIIKQLKGEAELEDKLSMDELESQSSSSDGESGKKKSTRSRKHGSKKRAEALAASDNDDDGPVDELPFCSICSEDAAVRCHDCDKDLFCNRCLREIHDEWGYTNHRTTPYKNHSRR